MTLGAGPGAARVRGGARVDHGREDHAGEDAGLRRRGGGGRSEKTAKLAQKLGLLQRVTAVLPQECMGQLASFGPT